MQRLPAPLSSQSRANVSLFVCTHDLRKKATAHVPAHTYKYTHPQQARTQGDGRSKSDSCRYDGAQGEGEVKAKPQRNMVSRRPAIHFQLNMFQPIGKNIAAFNVSNFICAHATALTLLSEGPRKKKTQKQNEETRFTQRLNDQVCVRASTCMCVYMCVSLSKCAHVLIIEFHLCFRSASLHM